MRYSIIRMFGINNLEEENNKLAGENISLARELEELKAQHNALQDKYTHLLSISSDPLGYVDKHSKKLEKEYAKCAEDCEAILKEYTARQENFDRELHKAYANGRADAYAEMGIRNIEAHERGNCLVRLDDGQIVEFLLDFEDVKADIKVTDRDLIPDDEIVIDDLVDIGA